MASAQVRGVLSLGPIVVSRQESTPAFSNPAPIADPLLVTIGPMARFLAASLCRAGLHSEAARNLAIGPMVTSSGSAIGAGFEKAGVDSCRDTTIGPSESTPLTCADAIATASHEVTR